MKKLPYILVLIAIIALFAGADYYLNNLNGKEALESIKKISKDVTPENKETPGFSDAIFKLNENLMDYKVISQIQTSQIFEKIDLSNINNIKIYLDRLEYTGAKAEVAPSVSPESSETASKDLNTGKTIYLYEIHGPANQGSLTYLNIKLQFIAQINATTETLNETSEYGNNSFFYNDQNYENIAFLLTQVGQNVFAFQFNKTDSAVYNDVKSIIAKLVSDSKSNLPNL